MLKKIIKKISNHIGYTTHKYLKNQKEIELLAIGSMLSKQQSLLKFTDINDYEFKIFSQWGDDGIIQYLIKKVVITNKFFVEFGVEDYMESNTRFLMMNDNWSGFVMDGSSEAMSALKRKSWYWNYDLTQKAAFIDAENINELLANVDPNIGILHIDIDGMDYHILDAMDLSRLNPSIIIVEYNSIFGTERTITVPYRKDFNRTKAHYSNLFAGASLAALNFCAEKKGYSLVCCNLAGNNAYFVRNDLLNDVVQKKEVKIVYKKSKYRESRDKNYALSFKRSKDRLKLITGLEVLNVITNETENL